MVLFKCELKGIGRANMDYYLSFNSIKSQGLCHQVKGDC